MAWLSGWDNRIKITIDHNKIDSDLSWHPITPFLTSAQAEEVFAELTTDAEYLKIAFTKADGVTQLFAEKEVFDVSELKAIFHISRENWAIASGADTDIYLYYDADHADNTNYIGLIGARTEVWDSNFLAVYHMVDDTTSTVLDSTSNNIDLSKASANNPIEATGKVGQGQDFSSDYMTHATFLDSMPDDLTIEMCIKLDTIDRAHYLFFKNNIYDEDRIAFDINSTNHVDFWGEAQNGGPKTALSAGTVTTATWYYVAGVHTHDAALKVYLDTAEDTGDTLGNILDGTYSDIAIGDTRISSPQYPVDGIMDELRFSGTPRTAAWLKGTYNSLWDTLLTYGSEETEPTDFEYVGTGSLTYSGSGSCDYEAPDWEYAGSGNFILSGAGVYSIGFAFAGSGSLIYSGEAVQIYTFNYLYSGSGELTYSGTAITTVGFACVGSGTYNFSGVGLYSLGLFYVGIGEFVYSGSATQVHIRHYLYAGSGVFTYSGDTVYRYIIFWSKVTREKEDFTKVEKEIDDWTKVNREKGDWDKKDRE